MKRYILQARHRIKKYASAYGISSLVFFACVAVLSGIVLRHHQIGILSPEVNFTDASPTGLKITPASCPSSPDYQGQCDNPPAPTLYSATCSGNAVTLNWSSVGNTSFYAWRIYDNRYPELDCGNAGNMCGNTNNTSTSLGGLGDAYNTWVYACNSNGCTSSNRISVTCRAPSQWTAYCTGGGDPNGHSWEWWQSDQYGNYQFIRYGDGGCVPPAPTNVSASCTNHLVTLNWSEPAGTPFTALRMYDTAYPWTGTCNGTGNWCYNTHPAAYFGGMYGNYSWWVHSCTSSGVCSAATNGPTVSCAITGTISASPNPCSIGLNQTTCTSNITWSTTNTANPGVFLRETGQQFAGGTSGTQAAPWITTSGVTFDLHETTDINSPILSSVRVSGVVTNNPPNGSLDAADCTNIGGWAYDPDGPGTSITVHLYKDGAAGTGTYVGPYPTNGYRSDVNSAFGITGNHGFNIPTPDSLKDGQAHTIYIHAIDTAGGANPVIGGSPKTIQCSPPPPTNLVGSCNADGSQGTLSWTAPGSFNTFYTRVQTGGAYIYPATDDNFVGTTKTFTTTPGATYTWWIHTKNTSTGASSNAVTGNSFTCTNPPPAPASMSATCSLDGTSVTLAWPAAPRATKYYPRYSTNTGSCAAGWTKYTDNTTCYLDGYTGTSISVPIMPNTTYPNGWVHAGDPVRYDLSANSGSFRCTPQPSTPVLSGASCSAGTATLTWNAAANADNYHPIIHYPTAVTCPSGWFQWTDATYCAKWPVTSTSITSSGLQSGNGIAPYEGFVYAYNSVSGWSGQSNHISFSCTLPPPTNPVGSCSADGRTGTFTWTAPSGYNTFYTRASSGGSNLGSPAWDDNFVGTTKTFTTTPGATYTWWVHTKDTNGGGWSNDTGGSFTCATQPNLTAGVVSPTSAFINSPTTLSATISNSSVSSTGASFYNFIQVASLANGGGTITDLPAASMSMLAGGASAQTSQTYTFATDKTYSARACADKSNSGSAGVIAESNEADNCGSWTNIVVTTTIAANIYGHGCILPANNSGCDITSYWTVNGLPSGETVDLDITREGGSVSIYKGLPVASKLLENSKNAVALLITALQSTRSSSAPFAQHTTIPDTYYLKILRSSTSGPLAATLALVACSPGYSIVFDASLGRETCKAPDAVLSLVANPTRVRANAASTLTWSAQNAKSCSVTNAVGTVLDSASSTLSTPHATSTGAITGTTPFTLVCTDLVNGSQSVSVTIGVDPAHQER